MIHTSSLFGLLFVIVLMVTVTLSIMSHDSIGLGCHVIGVEVNGDYTTEYLMIGQCY